MANWLAVVLIFAQFAFAQNSQLVPPNDAPSEVQDDRSTLDTDDSEAEEGSLRGIFGRTAPRESRVRDQEGKALYDQYAPMFDTWPTQNAEQAAADTNQLQKYTEETLGSPWLCRIVSPLDGFRIRTGQGELNHAKDQAPSFIADFAYRSELDSSTNAPIQLRSSRPLGLRYWGELPRGSHDFRTKSEVIAVKPLPQGPALDRPTILFGLITRRPNHRQNRTSPPEHSVYVRTLMVCTRSPVS